MDIFSHYTSVDGFKSIIDNKALRLTRSEFLNDPGDCKVLAGLIAKHLETQNELIGKYSAKSNLQQIYATAPLPEYIMFLQSNIHLYVLSLTKNSDEMAMWNYYGNGGLQIDISRPDLVAALAAKLKNDDEYIAFCPVEYVSDTDTLESITIPNFDSFQLVGKGGSNVFQRHKKDLEESDNGRQLYDISGLDQFMLVYISGYINSLEFLVKAKKINSGSTKSEIFTAVHNNANTLTGNMLWKKDLTLYMVMLSALIKSSTYRYEQEARIVYFENTLQSTSRAQPVKYDVQTLQGQRYIKPYIEIGGLNMSFIDSLTLSPLARNLPIDGDLYLDIVGSFARERLKCAGIKTEWSKHRIRW